MTFEVAALVPMVTACAFASLLVAVRRGAIRTPGARVFQIYLGFMTAWALGSAAWHLTLYGPAGPWTLRFLTLAGTTSPAVLLYFVQARYPTRWSRRARYTAYGHGLLLAVSVLVSNTFLRAVILSDPTVAGWQQALGWGSVAWMQFSMVFIAAYLLITHRTNRDPYERNRLKYMAAAATIILAGFYTNLVPALQPWPVDQALNVGAAALFALTIVRYRLASFKVVLRRSVIAAIGAAGTGVVYLTLVVLVLLPNGGQLYSVQAFFLALALTPLMGAVGPVAKRTVERAFEQTLSSRHVNRYEALMEFTRRMTGLLNLRELTNDVTDLCVRALDSSYTAILLSNPGDGRLELAQVAGPFPRPRPEWVIRADNPLLEILAEQEFPVTPLAFTHLAAAAGASRADIAEFEPYRECVMSPIAARGRIIGMLFLGPKVYDEAYSLEDMDLLTLAARHTAIALENAQLFEETQRRADTDFLTGLPNHRHLQDLFEQALEDGRRERVPLSIAMMDVDNFKLLNDVHGHQIGDEALRHVSSVMRSVLRPNETVGRYGGDEFSFILPGATKEQGEALLALLESRLETTAFHVPDLEHPIPLRISWGVASFPEDGGTRRGLISIADAGLMERRLRGRRVEASRMEQPTMKQILELYPDKFHLAEGLIGIVDAKDAYTSEHSRQDAAFAMVLADELGLPDRERYLLWLGALLHDVGKVGVPAVILRKPSVLTPDETAVMRQHVTLGESLVRGMFELEEVVQVVGCHHERFDGTGYPRGLKGAEIPKLARILIVVDAFSAMVHDRPYRKGLPREEAIEELRRYSGTQFDPEMVEAFIRALGHDQERAA